MTPGRITAARPIFTRLVCMRAATKAAVQTGFFANAVVTHYVRRFTYPIYISMHTYNQSNIKLETSRKMIEISIKECKKAFDNEKVGEKLTQLASKR